jgi:pullulanase/glycogen debranching enzyme
MATMMKTPQRKLHDYISQISEHADVQAGSPLPLGIQESGRGVNFAIFSRYATRVQLELFDHPEDASPARAIDLDSARNRTGDVWHVWVEGGPPHWTDPKEKQLACLIHEDEQSVLCLMFNAGADAVDFSLPPLLPGTQWHLAVDTSREAPHDLFAAGEEPLWEDPRTYHLSPRSSVILLARGTNGQRFQTALTEAK